MPFYNIFCVGMSVIIFYLLKWFNIFNIFAVIGLTSMVKPIEVSQGAIDFDMIWMIGIAVLMLFVLLIGKRIGRIKGAILVLSYFAYVGIIILKVKGLI